MIKVLILRPWLSQVHCKGCYHHGINDRFPVVHYRIRYKDSCKLRSKLLQGGKEAGVSEEKNLIEYQKHSFNIDYIQYLLNMIG